MLQQWRGAKCACLDVANVDELKKHYIKGREGGSANNCLLCKHKDLSSDPYRKKMLCTKCVGLGYTVEARES